jgi:hypothetical protein
MAIWEGEEENLEVEAVETVEAAVAVEAAAVVVQFVGLNFSVIYVA